MGAIGGTSLLLVTVCGAFAQTAPSFDVASVKVSAPMAEGRGNRRDAVVAGPAGVTMTAISLKGAIQWAYHMQSIQVSGPGWMDSDRLDINAKSAGPASNDQLRQMMQTLLAQRFKLTFHKETKEMPAYVVTVAKSGHKLKQSEGEGEMEVKPAGNRMAANFTHVTLSQLSEMMSSPLQAVVVDQTGLKGSWDFTLDMSGFMSQPTGIDDAIGMIIQAANEQLGIKIDQKKVPAEVLIVDHAERVPVEN
jgi:uncharacterized protein (TIGR03435 family)